MVSCSPCQGLRGDGDFGVIQSAGAGGGGEGGGEPERVVGEPAEGGGGGRRGQGGGDGCVLAEVGGGWGVVAEVDGYPPAGERGGGGLPGKCMGIPLDGNAGEEYGNGIPTVPALTGRLRARPDRSRMRARRRGTS